MTIAELRTAQKLCAFARSRFIEKNPLPSCADPTQDIPIKRLQLAANGDPINVRRLNLPFTCAPVSSLTAVDRRNFDKFDAFGVLQSLERSAAKHINNLKQKDL